MRLVAREPVDVHRLHALAPYIGCHLRLDKGLTGTVGAVHDHVSGLNDVHSFPGRYRYTTSMEALEHPACCCIRIVASTY
jgi:hypothetical protein